MVDGFGEHALLRQLGEGGMGTVWLARSPRGLVALKTMRRDQAADPRVRRMFEREMRLAASIGHRNVAAVLESGVSEEGSPYLVMEHVDGLSLRALGHAVGRLPTAIALRIARDACLGLHAAHELRAPSGESLGLVHRDVSPHNVLVSRDGVTKVIDFGVAKVRAAVIGDTTSSGCTKGKVRYMAPEQALGRAVDRRADIFAVGSVLCEMLTGEPLLVAENDLAILRRLVSQAPIPVPASIPEPVRVVLARALAKAPKDRFASAADLADALDHALEELGERVDERDVAAFAAAALPRPALADEPATEIMPAAVTLTSATTRKWRPVFAGFAAALASAFAVIALSSTHTAEASPASPPPAVAALALASPAAAEAPPAVAAPITIEADDPPPPVAKSPPPKTRVAERARGRHAPPKAEPKSDPKLEPRSEPTKTEAAARTDDMVTALSDRR